MRKAKVMELSLEKEVHISQELLLHGIELLKVLHIKLLVLIEHGLLELDINLLLRFLSKSHKFNH